MRKIQLEQKPRDEKAPSKYSEKSGNLSYNAEMCTQRRSDKMWIRRALDYEDFNVRLKSWEFILSAMGAIGGFRAGE